MLADTTMRFVHSSHGYNQEHNDMEAGKGPLQLRLDGFVASGQCQPGVSMTGKDETAVVSEQGSMRTSG
jgi:hypothetical protein